MIRALLKKQLLELGAAFVRSSKTGKRRSRAGTFGYALLFAVLMLLVIPAAEQMPVAGKGAGQHTDRQRRKLHQHKIEPVQPLRHQRYRQRQCHRAKAEHNQQHQHRKQQCVAKRSRPGAPFAGLAAAHKGRPQFQKLFFEQCTDHSASPVSSSSRKTSSSVSSPRTSSIAPSRTS